jgi:hypothetical protein
MLSSYERKGVSMGDDGFFDGGWYPHDGEGKIDNCPGPGCDFDWCYHLFVSF